MYVGGYWLSQDTVDRNPQLKDIVPAVPASKYHNVKTEAKGMVFQSGHEAAGVAGLIMAEQHKKIFGLRLQVRFPLPGGNMYVADAVYCELVSGKMELVVMDFKGAETPVFKVKRRAFEHHYGIKITLG
ncbi:MAG: DUF1064 domain-containing protein [Dehalococcoidales bacterium]|nr:DUF1064 domain-containing protein [Dehalococcoidales bacterium]